jgi:hypothetical protein
VYADEDCTLYSSLWCEIGAGWLMLNKLVGSDVPLKLAEIALDETGDAQPY